MQFPSKILLIGEYGLVAGGSGLAIPYPKFYGEFNFSSLNNESRNNNNEIALSRESIGELLFFLKENKKLRAYLNLKLFESDFDKGLWFNSNIPSGYGLGSSGALCAAIYSKYKRADKPEIDTTKQILSGIESFFHGSSSGIDPLTSFCKKPLVLNNGENAEILPGFSLEQTGLSFYLVDTGNPSKTQGLVGWFKEQIKNDEFFFQTKEKFLEPNNRIISNMKANLPVDMDDIAAISHYQFELLTPMIPSNFMQHFQAGFENGNFAFKLCGSGGGGYMLCVSADKSAELYLKGNKLLFDRIY